MLPHNRKFFTVLGTNGATYHSFYQFELYFCSLNALLGAIVVPCLDRGLSRQRAEQLFYFHSLVLLSALLLPSVISIMYASQAMLYYPPQHTVPIMLISFYSIFGCPLFVLIGNTEILFLCCKRQLPYTTL